MWLRMYSSTRGWTMVFFWLTLSGATIAIVSAASNQQTSLLLISYIVKIRHWAHEDVLLPEWLRQSLWPAHTAGMIFAGQTLGELLHVPEG